MPKPTNWSTFVMIKLSQIVKDYKDSGAVNSFVNLFGFIDDHVFMANS